MVFSVVPKTEKLNMVKSLMETMLYVFGHGCSHHKIVFLVHNVVNQHENMKRILVRKPFFRYAMFYLRVDLPFP